MKNFWNIRVFSAYVSEMITDPEWAPARVCTLGLSQYFRFDPEQELESTLGVCRSQSQFLKDLLKFL